MPLLTGTSRSRLRFFVASAPQRVHHPQEHSLPLVPRQQSVDQPTSALDDLARHQNDRVDESLELHPQQLGSSVFKCKTGRKGPSGLGLSGGSARSTTRLPPKPDSGPESGGSTGCRRTSARTSAW